MRGCVYLLTGGEIAGGKSPKAITPAGGAEGGRGTALVVVVVVGGRGRGGAKGRG